MGTRYLRSRKRWRRFSPWVAVRELRSEPIPLTSPAPTARRFFCSIPKPERLRCRSNFVTIRPTLLGAPRKRSTDRGAPSSNWRPAPAKLTSRRRLPGHGSVLFAAAIRCKIMPVPESPLSMREAANALNVSLRFFQGFLASMPPCHLQAGRRKLFDDVSINTIKMEMKRRAQEKCRTPSSPLPRAARRIGASAAQSTESQLTDLLRRLPNRKPKSGLPSGRPTPNASSLADRSAKPLTFSGAAE